MRTHSHDLKTISMYPDTHTDSIGLQDKTIQITISKFSSLTCTWDDIDPAQGTSS